jgi:hypothetical protein
MKKLPENQEPQLISDPLVLQIWEDVVYAMDQYTDDASVSKFFMPVELSDHCRAMAASFALLHFSPLPDMQVILKSRLYGVFYLSLHCGIQIYLKERAIMTSYLPYRILSDEHQIREIKNTILKQLAEGIQVYAPVNQVMDLFLQQLTPMKEKVRRNMKEQVFNDELYDKFLPVTMLWGYLFAREMILDC